jgi:hypothetical protein
MHDIHTPTIYIYTLQVMYSIETPWLHIGTDTASGSDNDNTILVKRDVIVRDIDECTYDGTNAYFKHKCVREVSNSAMYLHTHDACDSTLLHIHINSCWELMIKYDISS